jgi:hypothetical protein
MLIQVPQRLSFYQTFKKSEPVHAWSTPEPYGVACCSSEQFWPCLSHLTIAPDLRARSERALRGAWPQDRSEPNLSMIYLHRSPQKSCACQSPPCRNPELGTLAFGISFAPRLVNRSIYEFRPTSLELLPALLSSCYHYKFPHSFVLGLSNPPHLCPTVTAR